MNKAKLVAIVSIFIISLIVISYLYFGPSDLESDINSGSCELERDINSGKSIMGIWPHPDDECYTPGILAYAGGHRGNDVWVCTLIDIWTSIPYIDNPQLQQDRFAAQMWLQDKYLVGDASENPVPPYDQYYDGYIDMGMRRVEGGPQHWHGWEWTYPDNGTGDYVFEGYNFDKVYQEFKYYIDLYKPDILLTFTPYGFCENCVEHYLIRQIITDIWNETIWEPKPKIYWFVNTNQGPRHEVFEEYLEYPPTDILDLDVYSEELGMTIWEAKVVFWEHYAPSVGSLDTWMNTPGNLGNNDKKEYFIRDK
jgi:hypothetical protein